MKLRPCEESFVDVGNLGGVILFSTFGRNLGYLVFIIGNNKLSIIKIKKSGAYRVKRIVFKAAKQK